MLVHEDYYSRLLINYSRSIIRECKLTMIINDKDQKNIDYCIDSLNDLNSMLDEWFIT